MFICLGIFISHVSATTSSSATQGRTGPWEQGRLAAHLCSTRKPDPMTQGRPGLHSVTKAASHSMCSSPVMCEVLQGGVCRWREKMNDRTSRRAGWGLCSLLNKAHVKIQRSPVLNQFNITPWGCPFPLLISHTLLSCSLKDLRSFHQPPLKVEQLVLDNFYPGIPVSLMN